MIQNSTFGNLKLTNMNAITQAIELSGLDTQKAEILQSKFGNMVETVELWKKRSSTLIITDESQKTEIEMAKQAYKLIKTVRIDVEKTRKSLKEDSLKEGKAIDLIAKTLTEQVAPLEEELEAKAKFVEIQEAKRKAEKTQERIEKATVLGFAVPQIAMVADMSDEMFETYLKGLQADAEKREAEARAAEQARLEAEAKERAEQAERERLVAEAREALRIENERLKAEAEAREKQIAEERAEAEAERKKVKEENRQIQAEKDAQIEKEREERKKVEAKIIAKAEAERIEKERIEAEQRRQANAPDKEKLTNYILQLRRVELPAVVSEGAKKILDDLSESIRHLREGYLQKIEKL